MTPAQNRMYYAEWAKCRAALRAHGRSPAEADAERYRIHARCCQGSPKSSSDLTNAELSAVLASFWSWSHSADLSRQLRQDPDRQSAIMGRFACAQVYDSIADFSPPPNPLHPYLDAMFRRLNSPALDPDYGTADQWHTVFLACCYRYDQLARQRLNLQGNTHARLWPNTHQRNLALIEASTKPSDPF